MFSIDDLNKKPDFNLPEGYFEKMQDEVLTKIHRYEKKNKQRRIFYSIGAVAASLFIIFNIVYFFPDKKPANLASQNNKTSLKQIVTKIELNNLDYDIIEHYEESMYEVAFLDLYD